MLTSNRTIPRTELLNVLWDIQRKKRYISPEDIAKISLEFGMSKTEIEGVISFYHFFHFKDSGKFTIYLNNSIISEYSGYQEIKSAFEEVLGIKTGKVTSDKKFGLFETACIGLSDQEPACLINFRPFTHLNRQKVFDIIEKINSGRLPSEICDHTSSKIQYTPKPERTVFLKPYEQFSALKTLEQYSSDEIIETVKQSRLAGRGGAFFPTGLKWQFCRQNESDVKYIVCNADEGEPGTFKDRVLIQEHPELIIEGMIFAAYAVGASKGAIYLRAEYMYLKEELEKMLQNYRDHGYLGKNIPAKIPFE
ncbi:MAG: NAD(P)H-dependent oxidoreductase subunit E, partial [Flavobacteriaceae bacterium]|nr:NAD(P)H-dependent oxidoreductase subunit E [Flavobacteriaceae bacterium]